MDFGDYVRLVRRSAWIIVATIMIGVLVASLSTLRERPNYGSTSTGILTAKADTITDLNQVTTLTQQTVKTFANVATSATVLDKVIADLDLHVNAEQLATRVIVAVPTDSNVITVSAYATTGSESARIANTVIRELGDTMQALLPGSTGTDIQLRLNIVNPAVAPTAPESPKPLRNIAFGALAGLFLGLVIAVLRQVLDSRVTSLHDLERVSDRPTLGLFLRDERPPRAARSEADFARSTGAEAFRTLRTNLRFLEGPGASSSFVVTSPGPEGDRAQIAANLAISIADLGIKVIVIDADLRRSQLAPYLGFDSQPGLTDVLAGDVKLERAIHHWDDGSLHVLSAGTVVDSPNELVQSPAMPELVNRLRLEYDAVIFNTPPVLVASDAAIVSTYTRGALVVCEMDRTKRAQVASAVTALDRVGSPVLGFVVTGLTDAQPARYGRGARRASARPTEQAYQDHDGTGASRSIDAGRSS